MMDFQEKAELSARFIEELLDIPVHLCRKEYSEILACMKLKQPDFLIRNFPLFLTPQMTESFQPDRLYHITDFSSLNYNLFLYGNGDFVMLTGPYLTIPPDERFCQQVLQKNGCNASLFVPLYQFFLSLPAAGNSSVLSASRTALKVINGHENEVPYLHYQPQSDYSREVSNLSADGVDEAQMELLEHRYYYEKLMLQEVRQGNQDKALACFREFHRSSQAIIRTADPVRTKKNLSFSLNTMLRKSVEEAGIHPIYLDIISSNFAMLIENASRSEEVDEIQSHMISAYSRFVQKNRLNQYSPMIRRAVTYIHVHLADPLSLTQIAAGIRVSSSYLSRTFNRETGESLSTYITKTRVEKAAELLAFSAMSVQNISAYVGFSDLNYFSRCFRKYKDVTPTEYRRKSSVGA